MRSASRARQAGWSLLEAAVVVSIVGLMTLGFWKTLALVEGKQQSEHARDTLQRAEDALHGLALRDHRLPMPEDAVRSPLGPDHWEGWLPDHVLGSEAPRSIRYVVDRALAEPPASLYRADPLGLLGAGVAARIDPNGFDLCLGAIQREEAGLAAGGGTRLAFSVGGPPEARAASYLEFVHRLGCVKALAGLATEVKAAVLASDLSELARLDVAFRSLAVRDAEDSLRNHQWRVANAMARLAVSTWNLVATKLTGATTPLGAFKVAANVAGFTFEAARWAMLIDYSIERAARAQNTLDDAIDRRGTAQERARQQAAALESRLQRVNALQTRGLLP